MKKEHDKLRSNTTNNSSRVEARKKGLWMVGNGYAQFYITSGYSPLLSPKSPKYGKRDSQLLSELYEATKQAIINSDEAIKFGDDAVYYNTAGSWNWLKPSQELTGVMNELFDLIAKRDGIISFTAVAKLNFLIQLMSRIERRSLAIEKDENHD